jgi:rRNA maturation protein Nop10
MTEIQQYTECENCGKDRYTFEACQHCGHVHWRE